METKICKECGDEKDIEFFYIKNKKTGRRNTRCNKCVTKSNNAKRNAERKIARENREEEKAKITTKVCTKCGSEKDLDEFSFKIKSKGLRQSNCKLCSSDITSEYYAKNREDNLAKMRKRYYENADEINAKRRLDRLANIGEYRERDRSEYSKPQRHISQLLRARVYQAIKRGDKSATTMVLLGCTINELMLHLQVSANINYPGIAFDIRSYDGKDWHIDHVKPCSSFDLTKESEQKECFNYKNLQILTASDNLIKSDDCT